MKLSEFDYTLSPQLVAQHPLIRRDQARLMVIDRQSGEIHHDRFSNIGRYLPKQSVLVLNDSRVIPARLFGVKERSGGRVEIFLLKALADGYSFKTLLRPLQKIRAGDRIRFTGSALVAEVVDRPERIVRFNRKNVVTQLGRIGHIPLPPYIKRADTSRDRIDYQTVYARCPGSVAAPTAGLHFTKPLLGRLRKAGHDLLKVTLHVNYATFKTVEEDDITRHKMHREEYAVSAAVGAKILKARQQGRCIVAVGTTSCRVLETLAKSGKPSGETDLFMYPGIPFAMTDILITNFHLPLSSLLMLVYAFGGVELMKKAYQTAITQKYRFYSYGDAMIIV